MGPETCTKMVLEAQDLTAFHITTCPKLTENVERLIRPLLPRAL